MRALFEPTCRTRLARACKAVVLLLVLAGTAQSPSAAALQRERFTRLGSDSAEGGQGADLLYLDVAQRDDDLIVRFGIDQRRVLREQSEMSLLTWNFSVNTCRIYKINAYLDQGRYELLNASDTYSEDCADGARYLAGSFDRKLGVLTLRVPLSLLGIRGPATIGTNNYNDCYTGLPDVALGAERTPLLGMRTRHCYLAVVDGRSRWKTWLNTSSISTSVSGSSSR